MIKDFFFEIIMVLLLLIPCPLTSRSTEQNPLHYTITEKNKGSEKVQQISYIGNMGGILEAVHHTVMVYGLHQYYKPNYEYTPPKTVHQSIKGGYPGFSEFEAGFVSHKPKDHHSLIYASDFLWYNLETILVGSAQLWEGIEKVSKRKEKELLDRVEVVPFNYNINNINHLYCHGGGFHDLKIKRYEAIPNYNPTPFKLL